MPLTRFPRLRTWVRRGSRLLLAAILALLALELVARAGSALRYPRILQLDPVLGWRHAPGSRREYVDENGIPAEIVIDALGNRVPGHARERATGRRRLLVLGDSFVEGGYVHAEDLFTTRLEQALPALAVVNAGVGAWGTVQQLLYLQRDGLELRPDAVLLVVYANDLWDNCARYFPGIGPRPWAQLRDGALEVVAQLDVAAFEPFLMPAPARWFLYRHSALYRSLHKTLFLPRSAAWFQAQQARDDARVTDTQRAEVMAALLARMQQILREHRIPLLVAVIPRREDVAAGVTGDLQCVVAACQRLDVPCCQLLAPLVRAAAAGPPPYFATDIHWTATGHRVAAAAVVPFVSAVLDAPPSPQPMPASDGR